MLMTSLARSDFSGANSNSMLYVYLTECMLSKPQRQEGVAARLPVISKRDGEHKGMDCQDIIARDVK